MARILPRLGPALPSVARAGKQQASAWLAVRLGEGLALDVQADGSWREAQRGRCGGPFTRCAMSVWGVAEADPLTVDVGAV